jgi:tetratricopeptide (TPR) repeat protein
MNSAKPIAYLLLVLLFSLPCNGLSPSGDDKEKQLALHAERAREFLKSNRPEMAAHELEAILAIDPDDADARANLGVLLFFRGDYQKAAPNLDAALKLKPELWKIQALLGLCEKSLAQNERAQRHLEQCFPQITEERLRVEVGMALTQFYYAASDLDKAAETIGILRRLKPADPDILYTAHRIYSDLAEECVLSVAMTSPDSARMRQLMANELTKRGKTPRAVEQYREAIRIDPHLPGIHFQLAEALNVSSSAGDRGRAEREYEIALAENPQDAKSESRLAEIALARSDLSGALARYSKVLKLYPGDADANLGFARTLMEMSQSDKAEPYLLRAVSAEPFNAVTHMRLATVYRESGRTAEAARELTEFSRLKALKDRMRDAYQDK